MPKSEVFFVTPELRQVLENQPDDGPRSRLDPFRPFIVRWRRQGKTYRKIQEILATECKVRVHHETLRRFLKRRSRPRKPQPDLEFEPVTQPVNNSSAAVLPVERKPRMTAEERAALRASFDQPLFPTTGVRL